MRVAEIARAMLPVPLGRGEQRSWAPDQPPYGFTRRGSASVSYDRAQAHGAVYACVDLLVRIVAWQMPPTVYRAGVEVASVASPSMVGNPHPAPQMLAQHWRAMALESALLRGFAAGLVTKWAPGNWPAQVLPVHPDSVGWSLRDGRWEWRVGAEKKELWQLGGDLWVAPSPRVSPGMPVGLSPIRFAAESIALGLGASDFGRGFFENSSTPSGIISVDVPTLTKDQRTEIKQNFLESASARQPIVMGNIADYKTISVAPEESQFLETMRANVASVCMFFGIPPESIGGSSGDSMTYANVEGRNLSLLTNTAGTWMQWYEASISSMLPPGSTIELDPEALLRTSVPTLYDTAQKAVGRGNTPGVLTQNEARGMVGYSGHPDGDTLFVPVNYVPADQAGEPVGGGSNAAA